PRGGRAGFRPRVRSYPVRGPITRLVAGPLEEMMRAAGRLPAVATPGPPDLSPAGRARVGASGCPFRATKPSHPKENSNDSGTEAGGPGELPGGRPPGSGGGPVPGQGPVTRRTRRRVPRRLRRVPRRLGRRVPRRLQRIPRRLRRLGRRIPRRLRRIPR